MSAEELATKYINAMEKTLQNGTHRTKGAITSNEACIRRSLRLRNSLPKRRQVLQTQKKVRNQPNLNCLLRRPTGRTKTHRRGQNRRRTLNPNSLLLPTCNHTF